MESLAILTRLIQFLATIKEVYTLYLILLQCTYHPATPGYIVVSTLQPILDTLTHHRWMNNETSDTKNMILEEKLVTKSNNTTNTRMNSITVLLE